MDYFPCPICKGLLPVRTAKTGKPYLRCDPCGLQMFVRGKEGIRKLSTLLARPGASRDVYALSRALEHFADLGDRLREIEEANWPLQADADRELERKLRGKTYGNTCSGSCGR